MDNIKNIEMYCKGDQKEFWKIYRTLEKNPQLCEFLEAAATLNKDDLKEVTEYAAWLKDEAGRVDTSVNENPGII